MRFLTLAVTPALAVALALTLMDRMVDEPLWGSGFMWLALGVTLVMGTATAVADWYESRPCH